MFVQIRTVDSVQNTSQGTVYRILHSRAKYTADFARIITSEIFKEHESTKAET